MNAGWLRTVNYLLSLTTHLRNPHNMNYGLELYCRWTLNGTNGNINIGCHSLRRNPIPLSTGDTRVDRSACRRHVLRSTGLRGSSSFQAQQRQMPTASSKVSRSVKQALALLSQIVHKSLNHERESIRNKSLSAISILLPPLPPDHRRRQRAGE